MINAKGFYSFRELQSHQGLRAYKGVQKLKGDELISLDSLFHYEFTLKNLSFAVMDRIGGANQISTTRTASEAIEQTDGGNIEYPANTAAFDVGCGMLVSSGTRARASSFTEKGVWLIKDVQAGDFSDVNYTSGVREISATSGYITFNSNSGNPGTLPSLIESAFSMAMGYGLSGNVLQFTRFNSAILAYTVVKHGSKSVTDDFGYGKAFIVDLSQSGYFENPIATGTSNVRQLQIDAGYSAAALDAMPAPVLIDASSFKVGVRLSGTDISSGIGTLCKSGDMSLLYDSDLGQVKAKAGANTAVFSVAELTAVDEVYFAYDGMNIFVIIDGVSGEGVASSKPVLDASFDIMQDGAGGGYFDTPRIASFKAMPI